MGDVAAIRRLCATMQSYIHLRHMKKIIGFIAQKIGFGCGSHNSREFVDGWFLGAGITVNAWLWESCAIGRHKWKVAIVLHTRKDFKVGLSYAEYDCRVGRVFSFGYGAFVISHY